MAIRFIVEVRQTVAAARIEGEPPKRLTYAKITSTKTRQAIFVRNGERLGVIDVGIFAWVCDPAEWYYIISTYRRVEMRIPREYKTVEFDTLTPEIILGLELTGG